MSQTLTNDYKHITMIHVESKPKTEVFDVYTKSKEIISGVNEHATFLGDVRWYAPWRQYCFLPEDDCVFSKGCMADINDFITKLMDMRKTKQTERKV